MKKSKAKKKKDLGKLAAKPKDKVEEVRSESEKPFDFGGLPDRDLKKNLGCG